MKTTFTTDAEADRVFIEAEAVAAHVGHPVYVLFVYSPTTRARLGCIIKTRAESARELADRLRAVGLLVTVLTV